MDPPHRHPDSRLRRARRKLSSTVAPASAVLGQGGSGSVGGRRARTMSLLALGLMVLIILLGRLVGDPQQAFDTRCSTFLAMDTSAKAAVMVRSGVVPADVASRVAYFTTQCQAHPEHPNATLASYA